MTADGPRLVVVFNGQTTVDIRDTKYARGPIALQSSGGLIRFRKVLVLPI
ncbi:MAG: family 16 glycoside hydrolase [bacterium]